MFCEGNNSDSNFGDLTLFSQGGGTIVLTPLSCTVTLFFQGNQLKNEFVRVALLFCDRTEATFPEFCCIKGVF